MLTLLLSLEPLTSDILAGVKLGAFVGLGYLPYIDFTSIDSLDENSTFSQLSHSIAEDQGHLYRHKISAKNASELTANDIKGLNQSDYEALNYVGRYGGIFDPDFYLKEYSWVERSGIHPLTHYVNNKAQYSSLAPNSVFAQPAQILVASSDILHGDFSGLFNDPFEALGGLILGGFIIGGTWVLDKLTDTWEFVREITPNDVALGLSYTGGGLTTAPGVNLIDVSLVNSNNTPRFLDKLPGADDREITVEIFPGGVNVEEILDGSIFVSPDSEDIEFSGVVTTPKQTQNLDELLGNSVFTFPGETQPAGSYVYTSSGFYTPQNADILLNSQEDVVLELFGGRTGQLPGAINIDIIAEQGIRADILSDKLSFIPDSSVDQIVTFNPFIPKEAGGTGILDYLPEAARVLEPGGQIIINGTTNNKFTKVKQSDLERLGLRLVEKQIPLLDQFSDLTFSTIDGNNIRKERIKTTILEKI